MSRIRVSAIAVISRPSDGALLVSDGYDTVKRAIPERSSTSNAIADSA